MNIADEIRQQIEKCRELKLDVGEINNHLSILEGLVRKDIEERKNEAYQRGYDKGYADKTNNDEVGKELAKDIYQRGLDDAWEAARKIGHASQTLLKDMGFEFNNDDWFYNPSWYAVMNYTASKAIANLKAYEEKQKADANLKAYEEKQKADDEIKIGDEVIWKTDNITLIVTSTYKVGSLNWCDGVAKDGKVYSTLIENDRKTGKHYDIQSILEAMRT